MTAEQNADVMRRYLTEVAGAGNIELLEEIAAPDMVDHTAVAAGWGTIRHGLVRHVTYFRQTLADMTVTIERLVASADEVVGIWRVSGKHQSSLFGYPAIGNHLEWTNASVFRVADGRITDYSGIWGALEAVHGWASSRRQRAERVPGMPTARHPLGLPCQVRGLVVCGDGRGRLLGYPTANIALAGHPELPPDGVFAGEYRRPDGSRHNALISLGRRPTFYLAAGTRLLEAHLLDFSEPLYGEAAVVEFRHWIRDQRRFGSPEALSRQIERDASAVRAALAVPRRVSAG